MTVYLRMNVSRLVYCFVSTHNMLILYASLLCVFLCVCGPEYVCVYGLGLCAAPEFANGGSHGMFAVAYAFVSMKECECMHMCLWNEQAVVKSG